MSCRFLAGLIDTIGGGGGLISLPIYLLAGLPPHRAIATNKLSSSMGTAAATVRFAKMGHINFNIALSCSVTAILGSFLGASLSVYTNERIIQIFILVLLQSCLYIFYLQRKILILLSLKFLNQLISQVFYLLLWSVFMMDFMDLELEHFYYFAWHVLQV